MDSNRPANESRQDDQIKRRRVWKEGKRPYLVIIRSPLNAKKLGQPRPDHTTS